MHGIAPKTMHGKVTGYDGGHKEMEGNSYPHHLNGQGVSIFGEKHNSNSPKQFNAHHNAQGVEVFGPPRTNAPKSNYPHEKIAYKRTSIRAGAAGGKMQVRPMGKLV